jgi:hypothetical protein
MVSSSLLHRCGTILATSIFATTFSGKSVRDYVPRLSILRSNIWAAMPVFLVTMAGFLFAGNEVNAQSVSPQSVQTISVKDFGAKGDGSTNDRSAIQTAINATPPGGTLLVPPGQYLLNGSGTELILIGGKAITLSCSGWGETKFIVAASVPNTTDVVRLQGPSIGFVMQNCQFVPQSGTPARNALNLDATSAHNGQRIIADFVLSHNNFGGFGGKGIATTFLTLTDGVFCGVIEKNEIVNGIALDRAGDLLTIRDNVLVGRGPGIMVNLVGPPTANELKIEHNAITTCSGGVVVKASGKLRLQDNYFEPGAACANLKSPNGALVELIGSSAAPLVGAVLDGNLYSMSPNTADYAIYSDYTVGLLSLGDTFSFGQASQRGIKTTSHSINATLDHSTSIGLDYKGLVSAGAPAVTMVMPNGVAANDTGEATTLHRDTVGTPKSLGPRDGDSCVTGAIFSDAQYVYVCVTGSANNTSTIKKALLK